MFANVQAPPPAPQHSDVAPAQDACATVPRTLAHVVDSHELLKGHKTVDIVHNGLVYRLQATKLGKLILTK